MSIGSVGEVSGSGAQLAQAPAANTCVACAEAIDPLATVCPFCGTRQTHRSLKHVVRILKWAGGIASVAGIVTTAVQLYKLVQPVLEREAIVQQMVRTAEQHRSAGNHESATILIDEALELNPASLDARIGRIQVVMDQVRQTLWLEEKDKPKLEVLIPDLYQGVGFEQADKRFAANAYAHLGWLNYLRQDRWDSYPVASNFKKALELDAGNAFAHVFWASVCEENCQDRVAHAVEHFEAARKTGRDAEFVRLRTFSLLCERDLVLAWPHCFAFLEQVKDTAFWSTERKRAISRRLLRIFEDERQFSDMRGVATDIALAPSLERFFGDPDLQELFDGKNDPFSRDLWEARVEDLDGNAQAAEVLYRGLRNQVKVRNARGGGEIVLPVSLNVSVARMIGAHLGTLGLTWDTFWQTEALGLGDGGARQVQTVDRHGPAAKAGIRPSDIVLAVNGEAITSKDAELLLKTALASKSVELLIWRRGKGKLSIPVVLVERPFDEKTLRELVDGSSSNVWPLDVAIDRALYGDSFVPVVAREYSVSDLTDVLRREFDIPADIVGAFILNSRIFPGAFGAGDVILDVNGVAVSGAADFIERVQSARAAGEKPVLTRYRDGERSVLTP